jgi:hypothetical protein
MTGRRLARFAAMFGLLAGCGGGGSSKPLTESDFCAQKADAECQVTDRCVTTKDACKAERMALCTAFASAAKASGKRKFVAENVGTCINKTTAVFAKTSAITPADTADMDDACNYVFQGTGEVQIAECTVKYDCAGRVVCDKGFCANATTSAVNAPCAGPGAVCAMGSYCAPNASGNLVCTAKGMTGATCSATAPCLETLRCASGTCRDRLEAGSDCTSNDDCLAAAPYCDPYAGNKCDTGLFFAPNSTSCDDFGVTGGTPGTGGSGGAGGSGGGTGGGAGGRGGGGGSGTGGTGGSGTGGAGGDSGTGGSGTGGGSGGSGTGGGGGSN